MNTLKFKSELVKEHQNSLYKIKSVDGDNHYLIFKSVSMFKLQQSKVDKLNDNCMRKIK